MKILITGGTGFIGSNLCNELSNQNHTLIVTSRNNLKNQKIIKTFENITIETIDLTNFSLLEKCIDKHSPDVIFHLAGEISHKKSFENPLYDIDINSKSTLCILEIIKNLKINCKFILGGTFISIGKPTSLPLTEESICNPMTIYGANRYLSEMYCKIYHNMYGLDTNICRITNAYGPTNEYDTPIKNAINYIIFRNFIGKEVTIYDDGNFFRDLVYVTDVAKGFITVMENGKSGELYWISSGKKTWFYELKQELEKLTNHKIKFAESSDYAKKIDVGNFLVDNSKLKSLGWKPETNLKEGLEKTIEFFKFINLPKI